VECDSKRHGDFHDPRWGLPNQRWIGRNQAEHKYLDAAVAAGRFAAASMGPSYHYCGGACDNPNVLDKEAGALALKAFIALYEHTLSDEWIAPAAQAATYIETWTYAWSVPLPQDDPEAVYPVSRTTLGVSLIASGQSGKVATLSRFACCPSR